MTLRRIISLALMLLLSSWTAQAAVGPTNPIPVSSAWHFRAWQTDEGLPDNMVTGVAQTPDGFLWVATFGGLLRFDGAGFEEFPLFHLPNIPNRVVRLMEVDSSGRVWLAMDRGPVVCADKGSARVFTASDGLLETRITGMVSDGADGLWLTYGAEILHLAQGKVARLGEDAKLPPGGSRWVTRDAQGKVWISVGGNVGTLHEGAWQAELKFNQSPVRLAPARSSGLWICAGNILHRHEEGKPSTELARLPANVQVQAMLEDATGALWIGTASHGLFRWKDGVLERVPASNSQILCLAEDREGNIWVGTEGGGLNRLRPRAVEMIGGAAGLPFEALRCVAEDAGGVVWTVTENGLLLHNKTGRWAVAGEEEGWPDLRATCATVDDTGAVWVGTSRSSIMRLLHGTRQEWRRGQGFAGNARSMLTTTNGDLWVATSSPSQLLRMREGVLRPITMDDELRTIRALAETPDGIIWMGTAEGQLVRVDPHSLVGTIELASEQLSIRSLLATSDGSLWIGFAGSGIGRWKNGNYATSTAAQGLQDNYISQMQLDERGDMWITSNHGLFRVRLQQLVDVAEGAGSTVHSIIHSRSEGLPSFQPAYDYAPNTCRTADGQLWFATRNGLLHVQPDRIRESTNATPVVLKRVTVDDRVVALWDSHSSLRPPSSAAAADLSATGTQLPLEPGHRKIGFEFAALSYTSLENVNIRYRLENFDRDWIDPGSQRAANYPRLPAGHYEFQVQADNSLGVWNEAGFSLPFDVAPFFWQTWWFRSAVLLFFTGSIIGLVRYYSFRRLKRKLERLEQEHALHRERARIARDMHDEVGSKLSRLSLLSEMASQEPAMPEAARNEVSEISETARDTIRSLEEIVWAVNPKNDLLANLIHYLCRFAEDFFEGSSTQCVFEIPAEIPVIELPTDVRHHVYLAAKEALNNVCKHAAAREVCVRLETTAAGFEISIVDDGRGIAKATNTPGERTGNGLENMRERMRQAGGECEITSQPGAGTRVTLRVRRQHTG